MTTTASLDNAKRVADAVLYEGYLLYPYRATSSKNQVRWQFGVLSPAGAVEQMVGEEPSLHVQCLLQPLGPAARIDVHVRFLQTQWRAPEQLVDAAGERFDPVEALLVHGISWIGWHEAVEQEIAIRGITVGELLSGRTVDLDVPGGTDIELLYDGAGQVAGRLVRTRWPLQGTMTISATEADTDPALLVLRVEVANSALLAEVTPSDDPEPSRAAQRDVVARQSFVGTHLLIAAGDSILVSLVDPPDWANDVASGCTNSRCWPVLAGAQVSGQSSDVLLGAPIILGDFPAIAEESPGPLFDSAEIDEILTLRIMTMTDEEKQAARGTDPRAAAIIDRSDTMPPEVLERLHGALRGFDPPEPDFPTIATSFDPAGKLIERHEPPPWFNEQAEASIAPETDVVRIDGVPVSKNSRVRLRPSRRADAHDMFLAGQLAVVRRIDRDVDGETHIAVLLANDPAADLHDWHGRYYYFAPEEIEPLTSADARGVSS